ncbi:MAG: heme-binding protein [Pseudomonadota bacterium]
MVLTIAAVATGALISAGLGAWAYTRFGVERPSYRILVAEGAFEIRDYPALTVAEVTRSGERNKALRAGFRPLAGYIFAKERDGQSIAMTAPVTQMPVGSEQWVVRFIMPRTYDLDDLPVPASDVRLAELPPMRMAAVRFDGAWTDANIAVKERALRDWLASGGHMPDGPATYAYYNDPFTPGFLRRNEVLIPLRR